MPWGRLLISAFPPVFEFRVTKDCDLLTSVHDESIHHASEWHVWWMRRVVCFSTVTVLYLEVPPTTRAEEENVCSAMSLRLLPRCRPCLVMPCYARYHQWPVA